MYYDCTCPSRVRVVNMAHLDRHAIQTNRSIFGTALTLGVRHAWNTLLALSSMTLSMAPDHSNQCSPHQPYLTARFGARRSFVIRYNLIILNTDLCSPWLIWWRILPGSNVVVLTGKPDVLAENEDPRVAVIPLYAVKTTALRGYQYTG